MGQYLNRLYCMMAAMVTSYVVNMMYQINSAFAYTCNPVPVTETKNWASWNCNKVPGSAATATIYRSDGVTQATNLGIVNGTCDYAAAGNALNNNTYLPGLTAFNCYSDNAGDSQGSSGRASCYYGTYAQVTPDAFLVTESCGVHTVCDRSTVAASCFTGGNRAGYLVNTKKCACCPQATGSANYSVVSSGTSNILSIYNAAAIGSCYLIGKFQDTTGLFEFTDSNRCYYGS